MYGAARQLSLFEDKRRRIELLPKVDLHRHLAGSVRFATLIDLANEAGVTLPASEAAELETQMSVREPLSSLGAFVAPRNSRRPWHFLHKVIRSELAAERVAFEALEDAVHDNLTYAELRVSPYGVFEDGELSLGQFLEGIGRGMERAHVDFGIESGIVLSIARHFVAELDSQVARTYYDRVLDAAIAFKDRVVVGFDLSGNEHTAPPALFEGFFRRVDDSGFGITVHAGEGEPASNIRDAIELLGAQRIGHGLTLLTDPSLIELVREREVLIEQSVTCNIMTQTVKRIEMHPLPSLLLSGVRVAICTDNPIVLGTTLSKEMMICFQLLGLSLEDLIQTVSWANEGRFRPA